MNINRQALRSPLLKAALSFALSGCGVTAKSSNPAPRKAGGDPKFAASNNVGSAPTSTDKAAPPAPPLPTGQGLVAAQFFVHAMGFGTELCKGLVTLKVNMALGKSSSAQLFEIPTGLLKCSALGSIDLHELLSGVAQSTTTGTQTVVGDDVISVVSGNGSTFNPPRPMIPSFLSSTPTALANLNVNRNVSITTAKGTDSGTASIRMLSYNQPALAAQMNQTFPKVIDFVTSVTGFDKTDKIANTMFDSMEIKISTDPIAVVSLAMSATLGALSQGIQDNQSAASGLIASISPLATDKPIFGFIPNFIQPFVKDVKLDITMDLVSQDGLDLKTIAASSSGEKLGGVATGQ